MLYGKQFGFGAHHSTNYALVELADNIFDFFNERKLTISIFVDLSKAFGTVDHDILIKKINAMVVQKTI